VIVSDNASVDGSAEMVRERYPDVAVVSNAENYGFGRAIEEAIRGVEADALVVLNNDLVCEPLFVERIMAPFERGEVGMVAGVLVQAAAPHLIDSAGVELDTTLRSWDYLWNRPVAELGPDTPVPLGPCGGAAAYRLGEFRRLGGFADALFAYWEDVDLAIRFREAGWTCALAHEARAEHRHGVTLGATSPRQRRLDAFGRGFVLGRYAPLRRRPLTRLAAAAIDGILLARSRDRTAFAARRRGIRAGGEPGGPELARTPIAVPLHVALRRHLEVYRLGRRGEMPEHFRR
jgi:GT2 family glycosyltransferase